MAVSSVGGRGKGRVRQVSRMWMVSISRRKRRDGIGGLWGGGGETTAGHEGHKKSVRLVISS
jgi:hypothetical protein